MSKSKQIFKTFSLEQEIRQVIGQVVLLGVSAYAIYNFNENPVVISILVALLIFLFFSTGKETIIVYTDKFVIHNDANLRRFRMNKTYHFEGVKEVTHDGSKIFIEYENGDIQVTYSFLRRDIVKKVVDEINRQLEKNS